jgi:hypothetical protein
LFSICRSYYLFCEVDPDGPTVGSVIYPSGEVATGAVGAGYSETGTSVEKV